MNSRVAFGDDVVDGDDVGMVQRGGGLRFLDEAAAALGIARHFRRQHFDGDKAVEPRVLRLVDIAHAARAQLLEQLVLKNSFADHAVL